MTTEQLLLLVNGGLLTIVGFFLTRTMSKLDDTITKTEENVQEIALIKQGFGLKLDRVEEKFDELKDAVVDLTDELRKSREQSFKQNS